MKVRFSAVVFASPDTRVGVCGSSEDFGSWKKALPLSPMQIPQDEFHPSLWTAVIELPALPSCADEAAAKCFEYKFVRWTSTELASATGDKQTTTGSAADELDFPSPAVNLASSENDEPLVDYPENVIWEGTGGHENRLFALHEGAASSTAVTVHTFDPVTNVTPDGVYSLPVALFREAVSSVSEESHTTRYYRRLKDSNEMHYNKILDRVYVGTCPRSKQQVEGLKADLKISDVINFQTIEDIVENFPDPENVRWEDRSVDKVFDLYKSYGMRFVWQPTTDMCSTARAHVVAQSAFLLGGLLQRPDCTGVYVHCNAGVGRSTSCAVGFLHCLVGVPIRLTNLIMSCRRPVAYFDEWALTEGAKDFKWKYSAAIEKFVLPRFSAEKCENAARVASALQAASHACEKKEEDQQQLLSAAGSAWNTPESETKKVVGEDATSSPSVFNTPEAAAEEEDVKNVREEIGEDAKKASGVFDEVLAAEEEQTSAALKADEFETLEDSRTAATSKEELLVDAEEPANGLVF